MDFEWDEAKSERNRVRRELPFDLAIELFDGHVVEHVDNRRDYREVRSRAVSVTCNLVVVCIYTDRGDARRIISLRRAGRKERDAYRAKVPG
jgi:uncharacterized DUF497 family protein